MKRTAADGCSLADSSSNLGGIISLQVVVGIQPEPNFTFTSSCKIAFLPMSWQQGNLVKLSHEGNQQFDPSG